MELNNNNLPIDAQQGLILFYKEQYYDAHESFETAWRKTEAPAREFFRALLHISGGFYRLSQNRPKAAKKFFEHALKWLADFPDMHLGINTSLLKRDLRNIIVAIDRGQFELEIIKLLLHPIFPQGNHLP